jgi:hypothetical protein
LGSESDALTVLLGPERFAGYDLGAGDFTVVLGHADNLVFVAFVDKVVEVFRSWRMQRFGKGRLTAPRKATIIIPPSLPPSEAKEPAGQPREPDGSVAGRDCISHAE